MTGHEKSMKKKIEKLREKIEKRDRLLEFYARQWKRSDRLAHEAGEGAREITDLTNAVLIATAISYGAKTPAGDRVLALGEVNVRDLLEEWSIQAERKKGSYIVRIKKKKG